MKKNLLIVLAVFMTSVCLRTAQAAPTAPDFTLKDLSGKSVTLSSFRGKSPVLLVFSATWCPYCRRQIPNIIDLRKKIQPQDLMIYGVDVQEPRDRVAAFVASKGINYPVLLDSANKASDLYGASGIPFFVLVDRDGNVAATDYGVTRHLVKKIDALIKPKPIQKKHKPFRFVYRLSQRSALCHLHAARADMANSWRSLAFPISTGSVCHASAATGRPSAAGSVLRLADNTRMLRDWMPCDDGGAGQTGRDRESK